MNTRSKRVRLGRCQVRENGKRCPKRARLNLGGRQVCAAHLGVLESELQALDEEARRYDAGRPPHRRRRQRRW